jgi:hypothetical protein
VPLPPEPATPATSPPDGSTSKNPFEATHAVIVFVVALVFVWLMKVTCNTDPWTALKLAGSAAGIGVGMFATRGITKKLGVLLKKVVS